jgi:hypothetical protein
MVKMKVDALNACSWQRHSRCFVTRWLGECVKVAAVQAVVGDRDGGGCAEHVVVEKVGPSDGVKERDGEEGNHSSPPSGTQHPYNCYNINLHFARRYLLHKGVCAYNAPVDLGSSRDIRHHARSNSATRPQRHLARPSFFLLLGSEVSALAVEMMWLQP